MKLPDEFLQEVKYRNDIEDVAARYVNLKQAGANLVANCPFHSEKTPSFTVNKARQFFYCFGCGAGGDVITFVMKIENLDYLSAVARLAELANLEMPENDGQARIITRRRVYEMNREAALYYHGRLDCDKARGYIDGRGLKGAAVRRFGLGYAPDAWDGLVKHLLGLGYSHEEQKAAGLCSVTKKGGHIDFFRDRLMFPIIDVQGHVIAFGGRALGDDPRKYLNSPDTPVFKKNRSLYALNFAKNSKPDYFIMCEGFMDVISMHQAGFANAVATLGTAVTREQAALIERYVKRVVLAYDSDEAGKRAAQKAAGLLAEAEIEVRVLNLDGAKDPDEFISKYGRERLAGYLEQPQRYAEARIADALGKYDLGVPGEAERAINEACREIAKIDQRITREVYAGHLADRFKITPDGLFARIDAIRRRQKTAEEQEKLKKQREQFRKEEISTEEAILGALLNYPELCRDISGELGGEHFSSEFYRQLFASICEGLDVSALNEGFSAEQMGGITRMMLSQTAKMLNRPDKLKNYISLYKQKRFERPKDDWVNYIRGKS